MAPIPFRHEGTKVIAKHTKGEGREVRKKERFMRFRHFGYMVVLLLSAAGTVSAQGKLSVMASTQDLASIAGEVGGDRISVDSIAKGYQDPHFVEAKPSFLLKLRNADLLIAVGLDLEIGWLPPLVTQSGNPKIQVGAAGYLDASQFAEILDKPT